MSDLRGFTSLLERLAPEQALTFLNHYLETMVDVIMAYDGTIDEIRGDGIFVFFGAPIRREDDAHRAVACAVAMQLAIDEVNANPPRHRPPERKICSVPPLWALLLSAYTGYNAPRLGHCHAFLPLRFMRRLTRNPHPEPGTLTRGTVHLDRAAVIANNAVTHGQP
jgi:hypothetical protein